VVELGLRSERPGSRKYKSGGARARVDGNTCGLWRAWQFPFSIPCGTPKTCRPAWQGKRRWIASSRLGLARWPARRSKERPIVALGKPYEALSLSSVGRTEKKNTGNGRPLDLSSLFTPGVVNQIGHAPQTHKERLQSSGGTLAKTGFPDPRCSTGLA
jgi:hypothetical protein